METAKNDTYDLLLLTLFNLNVHQTLFNLPCLKFTHFEVVNLKWCLATATHSYN